MCSTSLHPFVINRLNWVCLQRNVCLYLPRDKRLEFCSSSSRHVYPWHVSYRRPVFFVIVCSFVQWACFVLWQYSDATRADSCVYGVHSAGSFSSCHLAPPPVLCHVTNHLSISLCRTVFLSNKLWLQNSHVFVAIQKDRKRNERKTDTTCPFCLVFTVDCRLNTKATEKPKMSAPCQAQTLVSSVFSFSLHSFFPSSRTVCSQLSESVVTYTLWWARYPVADTLTSKRKRLVAYRDRWMFSSLPHFAPSSWQLQVLFFFLNNGKS